ncbi:hypothetical protein HCN44_003861 [Aphidius gifuensis]|uniref:Uncharacterized protein n=1 Tax=Aphidius gifuensis TaxID=684658 RepID=A0A834Y030_APHGI|nr:hypothetical protein HCN44_003861 [Aphidius gifuensis]
MADNSWSQTLITVTPEEDGYLREITETTIISGHDDQQLDLDTDNITTRQSLLNITQDFIDPRELEPLILKESECQTYMKGVPTVEFDISYRDEATQTLYIGKSQRPSLVDGMKTITNVMNKKPLPIIKTSQAAQTLITFDSEQPEEIIHDILEQEIDTNHDKYPDDEQQIIQIEINDFINYIFDRVSYISDEKLPQKIIKNSIKVQTIIKYNYYLKKFMKEITTQTSLTLESKISNSHLIDDYLETKNCVKNYLDYCIDLGVYSRIMIDDFIDELIDKSCEIVRLPTKSEAIQTVASCQYGNLNENDVIKRLSMPVNIDPVEASIIGQFIVNKIIDNVLIEIRKNANETVAFIMNKLMNRIDGIADKLMEINREAELPSIDEKLILRKKKLASLLLVKKKIEDASTQTGFAGVPNVAKIKNIHRVVCETCPEEASCHWHSSDEKLNTTLNNNNKRKKKKYTNKRKYKLGTRDILLAYKPRYITADTEEVTNDMKLPCSVESSSSYHRNKAGGDDFDVISSEELSDTPLHSTKINVNKYQYAGSTSGWSNFVKDTADTWAPGTSKNVDNQGFENHLNLEKLKALEVLKNTFCTPKNCAGISRHLLDDEDDDDDDEEDDSVVKRKHPKGMNFCRGFDTSESDECNCATTREKNNLKIQFD